MLSAEKTRQTLTDRTGWPGCCRSMAWNHPATPWRFVTRSTSRTTATGTYDCDVVRRARVRLLEHSGQARLARLERLPEEGPRLAVLREQGFPEGFDPLLPAAPFEVLMVTDGDLHCSDVDALVDE